MKKCFNKNLWNKIDLELQEKLKDYIYTKAEALALIGCGEKTLRRYVEDQFITMIKNGKTGYFTKNDIDKSIFILKMKTNEIMNNIHAAGLYDFLIDKKCKVSFEELNEYLQRYDRLRRH